MKQTHIFKSVEYYSSTLAVIALSKDSLPAVQICSWDSPGAIKPKALAKPPYHFFLPPCYLSLLAGSCYRAQCPSAVLLAKRRACLLPATEASLHARLFRKAYFISAQGSTSQLDVNSQTMWNSKDLCWFMQPRSWPRSWYSAHLTS